MSKYLDTTRCFPNLDATPLLCTSRARLLLPIVTVGARLFPKEDIIVVVAMNLRVAFVNIGDTRGGVIGRSHV